MELPSKNKRQFVVLVNVCRLLLALALMLSGFLKAVDPMGGVYKLQEYATAFSFHGISDAWLQAASMAQAAVEFLIGLYLLMGVYRCVVPLMALVLMSLFTPFSLYLWVSGVVTDCGCFGESIIMSNGATFAKNVVLLLLAVLVFVKRSLFIGKLDSKVRWVLALFSLVYIFALQTVAVNHLPLIDAGDYVIGNNIRSMVEYTPGDYRYMSVYRKDRTEIALPVDSVPGEDWEFVKTYSELLNPGTEPLIGNFSFVDWEYDMDVADELLADTGYVYIVVVEDVEKASVTHIDRINDLYDYCLAGDLRFCAVSSSDEDALAMWAKRTGAEYTVCWADRVLLRSMVHANPGVVVLKNGVVVGKWAIADMPSVEKLEVAPAQVRSDVLSCVAVEGWPFWVLVLVAAVFLLSVLGAIAARAARLKEKKQTLALQTPSPNDVSSENESK